MAAALSLSSLSRAPTVPRVWRAPAIASVPLPYCLRCHTETDAPPKQRSPATSAFCRPIPPAAAPKHRPIPPPAAPKKISRGTYAFCRPIPPPETPVRLFFPGVGEIVVTPPSPPTGDTAARQEWVIRFPPPPATSTQSTGPPSRPDEAGPLPILAPANKDSQGLPEATLNLIVEVCIPNEWIVPNTSVPEIAVPTASRGSENLVDTLGTSQPEPWRLAALANDPIGELARLVKAVDSRIIVKIIVGSIMVVLIGLGQLTLSEGELTPTKLLEAALMEVNLELGKWVLTHLASSAIKFLDNAAGAKPEDDA